ncbi:unnamed protein product [Didymodactylos carnosus]|uniref:Uncharacterized protein n=1 Tax=Didymodactylos carnosus TaxID=1234261 RepID=A0A814EJ25_9BILA|nr:unnamed protein product [Didymodactylos carnosus]CAF0970151.1 unnamed protein product [Didymodactylos carnosus]CAF3545232.1 unnamed protein product [Didymodactylos carnosus]CAF3743278.1 unnamed protein product [Didymodactylos carnosus]
MVCCTWGAKVFRILDDLAEFQDLEHDFAKFLALFRTALIDLGSDAEKEWWKDEDPVLTKILTDVGLAEEESNGEGDEISRTNATDDDSDNDLHITEETAYDKSVTEGTGKNKVTKTDRISGTSYHDVTKLARSLDEQKECLKNGKINDLGYKCEPLFGDLFTYKDYVLDTLHMKLRIFDVLLKDILAHASRTGQYGAAHTDFK